MAIRTGIQFGQHLKELRIHLCQTSIQSQGLRDFVGKYYPVIKSSNPHLPVLIRECSGVSPRIWARLDHGRESSLEAGDKSPDNIWKELLALVQPEKGT